MEFGLFNSACVLPQFRGDEHRRIMDDPDFEAGRFTTKFMERYQKKAAAS